VDYVLVKSLPESFWFYRRKGFTKTTKGDYFYKIISPQRNGEPDLRLCSPESVRAQRRLRGCQRINSAKKFRGIVMRRNTSHARRP